MIKIIMFRSTGIAGGAAERDTVDNGLIERGDP